MYPWLHLGHNLSQYTTQCQEPDPLIDPLMQVDKSLALPVPFLLVISSVCLNRKFPFGNSVTSTHVNPNEKYKSGCSYSL